MVTLVYCAMQERRESFYNEPDVNMQQYDTPISMKPAAPKMHREASVTSSKAQAYRLVIRRKSVPVIQVLLSPIGSLYSSRMTSFISRTVQLKT